MRNVDTKEFKKAMIEVGIDTFSELSAITKVDKTTISDIANNARKPSYDTIQALADGLHLKYDEIGRIFFANDLASEHN